MGETTAIFAMNLRNSLSAALVLIACAVPLEGGIIADSKSDFAGVQGEHGWHYGYRNLSTDGERIGSVLLPPDFPATGRMGLNPSAQRTPAEVNDMAWRNIVRQ
jgi:hypothetical protein